MKPFNLERALAGDPVVTRGGKKVVSIQLIRDEFEQPRPLMVREESGQVFWLYKNGRDLYNLDGAYDLLMAPKKPVKQVRWGGIYQKNGIYSVGTLFKEEAECRKAVSEIPCLMGVVKVEWEE